MAGPEKSRGEGAEQGQSAIDARPFARVQRRSIVPGGHQHRHCAVGASLPRPLSPTHKKISDARPPLLPNKTPTSLLQRPYRESIPDKELPAFRVSREAQHRGPDQESSRDSRCLHARPAPPLRAGVQHPVAVLPAPAREVNSLILRGDYWELCYDGRSALIEDCRGLRYIAILVQHAAAAKGPLHAAELVSLATGKRAGTVELAVKEPVIDAVAEQRIIKRLEEIAFERNTADARNDYEAVARLDEEVERITDELAQTRTGRRRRGTFNDAGERARKAVAKAINDAIAKIAAHPNMKVLAQHLSAAIRKGQWLSYGGGVEWQVELRQIATTKKTHLRPAM